MRKTTRSQTYCVIHDRRAVDDELLWAGLERLRSLGHTVLTREINEPGEVASFAGESARRGVDRMVAVGGDGTLSLMVNGIVRSGKRSCAAGIIPYGTANDFADAAGILYDNALDGLDLVVRADPVAIDLGGINDVCFINVVTGGFPAEAAVETSRSSKEMLGKYAYLLTGLTNIASLEASHVRFSGPSFEWEGDVYAFGLGNSRQAGGGFSVCPRAVVNDGLLDLMIIPYSEAGLTRSIADFSRMSRLGPTERIVYRQIPSLRLVSRETIHLNVDGEPTEGRDFQFEALPRALPFCLPRYSSVLIPPRGEES